MGQTIWFLTGNVGKLAEAEAHLSPLGYHVKQLVVDENELYEPQATSLEVVAESKINLGEGVCPGHIALHSMEGNGFGFDPIFIPYDLDENLEPLSPGNYGTHSTHGKTFGAVEFEVKHKFSHRTKALQNLFNQLPSA